MVVDGSIARLIIIPFQNTMVKLDLILNFSVEGGVENSLAPPPPTV